MNVINWTNLPRPIVALAPMADMTDSAFCRTVRYVTNADDKSTVPSVTQQLNHSTTFPIIFREMVSAEAVVRGNKKTFNMTSFHPDERPIVQQIFGSDPDVIARAASAIEEACHPDGFDINMGCPVYKMVNAFNGAALMKEPDLAAAIVKKVKSAVTVPLSVKIRSGWEKPEECLTFGKVLEDAGADMIAIHGRTKKQGYTGSSDWNLIQKFKQTVSIPVLAGGDIFTPQLAIKALEQTKCDGIMIARGSLGNPWIFAQIRNLFEGTEPKPITIFDRIQTIKQHAKFHVELYGEQHLKTFRKHLTWYLKGLSDTKQYKDRLHHTESLVELNDILDEMAKDEKQAGVLSRRDAAHPLASQPFHLTK